MRSLPRSSRSLLGTHKPLLGTAGVQGPFWRSSRFLLGTAESLIQGKEQLEVWVPSGTPASLSGHTDPFQVSPRAQGSLGTLLGAQPDSQVPFGDTQVPFGGLLGALAPSGKCPQTRVLFGDPWKSRTPLGSPRCWGPLGTRGSLGEGVPRALGPLGTLGPPWGHRDLPLTMARGLLGGDSECMLLGSLEEGTTARSPPVPVTPCHPTVPTRMFQRSRKTSVRGKICFQGKHRDGQALRISEGRTPKKLFNPEDHFVRKSHTLMPSSLLKISLLETSG